jgi:hypothetical protein
MTYFSYPEISIPGDLEIAVPIETVKFSVIGEDLFCILHHRSELQASQSLTLKSASPVSEKDRAGRRQLDQEADRQHQG